MIRYADLSDLNSLLNIENSVFTKNDFPLSSRNFKYHIEKKQIFVIEIQNIVCAYLLFFSYKNSYRVYSLAVLKEFSNQGLGKTLLDFIINIANKESKNVSLEVKISNDKAISLYKKLGFFSTKTLKNYYNLEDGLKMILPFK